MGRWADKLRQLHEELTGRMNTHKSNADGAKDEATRQSHMRWHDIHKRKREDVEREQQQMATDADFRDRREQQWDDMESLGLNHKHMGLSGASD